MESRTSAASTQDWIEATKEMTIVAYIEPGVLTQADRERPLTKEALEDALTKVNGPIAQKAEPRPGKERSQR